jgi:hypothetical protein
MKVKPYLTQNIKINSIRAKNLKMSAQTIKPLKEKIGVNYHDLGFSIGFLDMTPKAQVTTRKRSINIK